MLSIYTLCLLKLLQFCFKSKLHCNKKVEVINLNVFSNQLFAIILVEASYLQHNITFSPKFQYCSGIPCAYEPFSVASASSSNIYFVIFDIENYSFNIRLFRIDIIGFCATYYNSPTLSYILYCIHRKISSNCMMHKGFHV